MIVLRAPAVFLFGEFRGEDDILQAEPGELLVIPSTGCRKRPDGSACLCSRAFIGAHSGAPVTMAVVCEIPDEDAMDELACSPVGRAFWPERTQTFSMDYLLRVHVSSAHYRPGALLRVRTTEAGKVLCPVPLETGGDDTGSGSPDAEMFDDFQ